MNTDNRQFSATRSSEALRAAQASLTGLLIAALIALCPPAQASNKITPIDDDTRTFGPYTVYFHTVSSLLIPAEVAQLHQLVRAEDQTLVNIAIKETATGKSVAGEVSGTATNLLQQSKDIGFKTITEPEAQYYIGAVRHSDKELFHLDIALQPDGSDETYEFRITRKLYLGSP